MHWCRSSAPSIGFSPFRTCRGSLSYMRIPNWMAKSARKQPSRNRCFLPRVDTRRADSLEFVPDSHPQSGRVCAGLVLLGRSPVSATELLNLGVSHGISVEIVGAAAARPAGGQCVALLEQPANCISLKISI